MRTLFSRLASLSFGTILAHVGLAVLTLGCCLGIAGAAFGAKALPKMLDISGTPAALAVSAVVLFIAVAFLCLMSAFCKCLNSLDLMREADYNARESLNPDPI